MEKAGPATQRSFQKGFALLCRKARIHGGPAHLRHATAQATARPPWLQEPGSIQATKRLFLLHCVTSLHFPNCVVVMDPHHQ